MISSIKVTARSTSMEEAEREIEMFVNHARMAGYLEGIAPQSSRWTDNHFERVQGSDGWRELGMEFLGRATITFDPDGPYDGGLREYGYRVVVDESDAGVPLGLRSGGDGEEVTATRIVLERQRPVTRDFEADRWLAEADLLPKPTAHEMRAFTVLAGDDRVSEIAFGPAKSRRGYEIDLTYFMPTPTPETGTDAVMSIGGRQTIYGETFSQALAAAQQVLSDPFSVR